MLQVLLVYMWWGLLVLILQLRRLDQKGWDSFHGLSHKSKAAALLFTALTWPIGIFYVIRR